MVHSLKIAIFKVGTIKCSKSNQVKKLILGVGKASSSSLKNF